MQIHSITTENFQEQVLNSSQPVLLDFYAPWCGPCTLLRPVLEEIAAQRSDIRVCKVDVIREHTLASQYKVFQIPTLLVMREGQEQDRVVGARPKEKLLELFA